MAISNRPVALVTGSGRGIGRGIALRLAQEGFTLVINSVTADPAQTQDGAYEVQRTIREGGGEAEVFKADIGSAEDRAAMLAFIEERLGRIDLLVNNAGVAPAERADILDASEESFDRLMRINLKGPYFLTQAVAKRMIQWKQDGIVTWPRICFITSISAYAPSINRGDYCVSKAGLTMASQLFASRMGKHDIPVIEIRPGITRTRMTGGVKDKYDKLIEEGLLATPRWGQPDDVGRAVAAFARGDLDYSTGVSIDVSGGFNLRRL